MSDPVDSVNAGQRKLWTEISGPTWVRGERIYDRMIAPHGQAVVAALAPTAGERVLDIGCGFGTTSLQVAELVGPSGHVHGVDISPVMIERAQQRAALNVSFEVADAQVDALGSAQFDAVISRFGVMFFADPEAAFANIRAATRTGARLAFVCWQGPARNPQFTSSAKVIRPMLPDPPPPPDPLAPGPMALADPARIEEVLTGSGWSHVTIEGAEFPMRYDGDGGDGIDAATEHALNTELGRLAKQQLDDSEFDRVVAAIRAEYASNMRDGHVEFDSAVWLVTASNPSGHVRHA